VYENSKTKTKAKTAIIEFTTGGSSGYSESGSGSGDKNVSTVARLSITIFHNR